jgi:hypothetical protein
MKNIISLSISVCVLLLVSCGPAAEDRYEMHRRANLFQDSIANLIRQQMAEAEGPSALQIPRPDADAKGPDNNTPR